MSDITLKVALIGNEDVRYEDIEELIICDPDATSSLSEEGNVATIVCSDDYAARSIYNYLIAFGFAGIEAEDEDGENVLSRVKNAPPILAEHVSGFKKSDYVTMLCPRTRSYLTAVLDALTSVAEEPGVSRTIREGLDVFTELSNFDLLDTQDSAVYVASLAEAAHRRHDSGANEVEKRLLRVLDALSKFTALTETKGVKLKALHEGSNAYWNEAFHAMIAATHEDSFLIESEGRDEDDLF